MKLKTAIRRLEKFCPLDRPVEVQIVKRVPWWADSQQYPDRYVIRLDGQLDGTGLLDTLAHEWAHCMVWGRTRVDHGELTFRAYSRTYRVLIENWQPRTRWRP